MSASIKLYEISDMRAVLDTWLAEAEGELTPEIEALLSELDGKADEKIERVALYIREREATAKMIKEQADVLAARAKRETTAAASLKAYLQREMERLGKSKVVGLLATVTLQNNPPSVIGEVDVAALWDEHDGDTIGVWRPLIKYVPESFVLDRKAVLDAAKAGQPIPDGLTVVQAQSLRVR